MSLLKPRIVQIDLSKIEYELSRLNNNLEQIFQINAPTITPGRDFDSDDYSSVLYTNEEDELIQEHVNKHIPGTPLL